MRPMNFIVKCVLSLVAMSVSQGAQASVDEKDVKLLAIGSADVRYSKTIKKNVPNEGAVSKALRQSGVAERLELDEATYFKEQDTFTTSSYLIEIPKTRTGSMAEAHRLNVVKASAKDKPFGGFKVIFPRAIYMPYSSAVELSDDPIHICISPRVKAIKSMRSIILDAISRGTSEDLSMIYSLGHRLGQFQAASLRKAGDEHVSDVHFNLTHSNIIPTLQSSNGTLGEFSLMGNTHIVRGDEYRPCPVTVDTVYFLLRSMAHGIVDPAFSSLPAAKQKSQMMGYIATFFHGYILAFDEKTAKDLRLLFTTMICINGFKGHTKFPAPELPYKGKIDDFYGEILFPASNGAFQVHEIPAHMPYMVPDFYPELLKLPMLHAAENSLPKGFNRRAYSEMYPDVVRDAPRFMMRPERFAGVQHQVWGKAEGTKKEGRIYVTTPFVWPTNFCSEAYREMYPDIDVDAPRFFMDPNIFAKVQYAIWGKNQGRLVLSRPIVVPRDFNAQRYLEQNPSAVAEAKKYGIDPLRFARAHYSSRH